jgi:hypothetical protein
VNATIADAQGGCTIVNDDFVKPTISIDDVTMTEGNSGTKLFIFTVTLSEAIDLPVTMSFKTVNGTAKTTDNDYLTQTGTLTFNPGETTSPIRIVVQGDAKTESNEVFYLDLYGNSANSLLLKKRGVGTILNDD